MGIKQEFKEGCEAIDGEIEKHNATHQLTCKVDDKELSLVGTNFNNPAVAVLSSEEMRGRIVNPEHILSLPDRLGVRRYATEGDRGERLTLFEKNRR